MMNIVLKAENISKQFADNQVLKNVNLSVEAGEFLIIMGPSGSGKSTLLYNISGMDLPTSGNITFQGVSFTDLSDEEMSELRLKHMGFIFQQSYLLKNLSIRDNIVLPGFKANLNSRQEVNDRADTLLKMTGILDVATHDIKQVSGGELQRAAICRSLINQPSILFGDEPTGALNSRSSKEVMDIIQAINKAGTTVVIITHDPKVAQRASRIIYLSDGKVQSELAIGSYEEETSRKKQREQQLYQWLERQGF